MRSPPQVLKKLLGSTIVPAFMATALLAQTLESPNGHLALEGGTIYVSPSEEPILNGVVVI